MFRNYLKTALRNLWREKGSSILNISGLTMGITSSLVLFLLIKHAVSFDKYHTNRDRIFRVVTQSKGNDGLQFTPGVPAVLPEAFKNDFPEAEEVTFTSYRAGSLVTIPQPDGEPKKYDESKGVVFAEPGFFKIFDRKILMGDAIDGLAEPNKAVISKKSALKYFGREDAIGETVAFDNTEYIIAAVMEGHPKNTDFPFDLMLAYATIQKQNEEKGWNSTWSDEQCYFLLKENVAISEIEARIPDFVNKYIGDDNPNLRTFLFQPLADIHYDNRFTNYNYNVIPRPDLIALGVIAAFLMLTACINFINLTTAEAIKRSKEVGIRKSLGSTRGQLVIQYLGETTLITVIAVLLSLAFTQLSLSFLNPFLEQDLSLDLGTDILVWIFLVAITSLVSLLSGLYPSLVVSGFKPALAMKNLIGHKGSSGYNLRRGLVVMQFFISQVFIIGTLVIIRQTDYVQNKSLGFTKEAVLSIPVPERESIVQNSGIGKMRTLRNELEALAGVSRVSLNNAPPASGSVSGTHFTLEGIEEDFGTQVKLVDGNYIDLFGIQLLAGEKLMDRDTATGFVVNEKLVKTAGYADINEIIGKEMHLWGKRLPVVGVVNDFHTMSLSKPIEPVVLFNHLSGFRNLSIQIRFADMQETIAQVRRKWEAVYPDFIFHYEFLDEQVRNFYSGQRKISVLLTIFTSLAIFIGCLGLFGLAAFMANQKTKEIGIRKVLGATVESILFRFSKEFIVLVIIGFLLAAPASGLMMREYLDQFAYRISLGPAIFFTGAGITLLIAMLTVGYKSFKAATINPVDSLRYE